MSYTSWFDEHAKKHKKVVQKLLAEGMDKEAIIAYFDFENMVENEPDFCPLYRKNNEDGSLGRKCHDLEALNCYLCACPNFRFNDEGIEERGGKKVYSYCAIDSKEGRQGVYGEKIHQDCSGCTVPHHVSYVRKHYDEEWETIMKACRL
jgi:hypothetical protein